MSQGQWVVQKPNSWTSNFVEVSVLSIIWRVFRLEVSEYTMFTLQTSFKPLLHGGEGGGVKSVRRGGCEKLGEKLLRLSSQLRPRIRPQRQRSRDKYRTVPNHDTLKSMWREVNGNLMKFYLCIPVLYCNWVRNRIHIMTRYKLFREVCYKRDLYFRLSIFVEIVTFYLFFRVVLHRIHFGSAAARIRNDYFLSGSFQKFRIRPDPDPKHFWLLVYNYSQLPMSMRQVILTQVSDADKPDSTQCCCQR
jgi:hypothetical protein